MPTNFCLFNYEKQKQKIKGHQIQKIFCQFSSIYCRCTFQLNCTLTLKSVAVAGLSRNISVYFLSTANDLSRKHPLQTYFGHLIRCSPSSAIWDNLTFLAYLLYIQIYSCNFQNPLKGCSALFTAIFATLFFQPLAYAYEKSTTYSCIVFGIAFVDPVP